jgi:hypothetical protein
MLGIYNLSRESSPSLRGCMAWRWLDKMVHHILSKVVHLFQKTGHIRPSLTLYSPGKPLASAPGPMQLVILMKT